MTYKTLLVDDEILTIRSLEKLIPALDPRFSIVGSARNGKIAYDQIKKLHPDLILLDVNMPICSGLQLMEQARAENYDCLIIILSAYREFEYAQTAMQHGASQYLLKPLEPARLKEVLAESAEKLEKKQQQASRLHEMSRSLLPDRLTQLFSGSGEFTRQYLSLAKQYDLPGGDLLLGGGFNFLRNSADSARQLVRRFNHDLNDAHAFSFSLNGSIFFLLHRTHCTADALYDYLLKQGLSDVRLCVSKPVSPAQLPHEAVLIANHLKSLFYDYDSRPVFLRSETVKPPRGAADPAILDRLHNDLLQRQPDEFFTDLEQYMLDCDASKSCDPENVYKIIYEIIVLFKTSDLLYDETLKLELNAVTYSSLHLHWNIDQLFLFIYNLSLRFLEQSAAPEDNNTITLAKAFCGKHYQQNISLQDVADHVHMSKAYFSTYFKTNTGSTFSAYLTNVRMDVAKYLLTSTNQKIGEIAAATGYTNTSHFIRTFREQTQMPPQEYRNTHH